MAFKKGGGIFHFNVTDLACVKILKVKISHFRVNLEHFVLEKLENTIVIFIKIAAKTELRQNDKICRSFVHLAQNVKTKFLTI